MTAKQRKTKSESFTPAIDKRIIKGFLKDRKAILLELSSEGFSRNAIIKRAGKLGLTEQLIKHNRLNADEVVIRKCLGCNNEFVSMGQYNRLCRRCQTRG